MVLTLISAFNLFHLSHFFYISRTIDPSRPFAPAVYLQNYEVSLDGHSVLHWTCETSGWTKLDNFVNKTS